MLFLIEMAPQALSLPGTYSPESNWITSNMFAPNSVLTFKLTRSTQTT
jgi:hypothetical protein